MEDEVGRLGTGAVGCGDGESTGVEPPVWTLLKGGRKRLSGSHRLLGGGSEGLGLVPPPHSLSCWTPQYRGCQCTLGFT